MKTILRLAFISVLVEACNLTAATLYVSQANPNPAPPYATWDSAATNIQDAIEAASAGDTVLVTNGVYSSGGRHWSYAFDSRITNRVALTKPLTVVSIKGPAFTSIVGAPPPAGSAGGCGAIRCVY